MNKRFVGWKRCGAMLFLLIYLQVLVFSLVMNSFSKEYEITFKEKKIPLTPKEKISKQVHFFDHKRDFKNSNTKLILLWTPFFNSYKWGDVLGEEISNCRSTCSVTTDKSRVKEADVIVFHIYDLWFWVGLPKYRRPDQVWVIWTAEPPTRIWMNLRGYENVFNWTMTYRRDSTVEAPFAEVKELTDEEHREKIQNWGKYRPFKDQTRLIFITNSDCYDEAQRYRIVEELRQYLPVDFYGKCGNLTCPRDNPECDKKMLSYKFRFSLENSYCDDYISEKYWNALQKGTIPIVNWKPQQTQYHVIPNSYINVFDFRSIKEAAEHIKKVSNNETLYKQYNTWRKKYKLTNFGIWRQFCKLCSAAHDPGRPQQVIKSLQKWIEEDSCPKGVLWSLMERRLNRHLFDLGF